MKKLIFIFIAIVFTKGISFGQEYPVSIKFTVEKNQIYLDSTVVVFFVLNGDTIFPKICGDNFNVPKSIVNCNADFYFIFEKYKLAFYSVTFNEINYPNRIWIVNIDKRPIDKADYYYVNKSKWWRIKWIYTLVRGDSQVTQYVYWLL
ncbi:MAG: hypothetical protein U0T82_13425 [Bacteroidales bacterium]